MRDVDGVVEIVATGGRADGTDDDGTDDERLQFGERARFLCVGIGVGIGIGGSTVFDGGRSGGNDDGDGRWWV